MMTIDKIKYYMNPDVYEYWINCTNVYWIERAKIELESEINLGILTDIKYIAELNLLNHLLSN